MLNATALYSQYIFTDEQWKVISLNILNEHAENTRLRADAGADSITIANLYAANAALQKALEESDKSLEALRRVIGDDRALIKIYEDEIKRLKKLLRRQKVAKFFGWGTAAVILFVAVSSN